MAEFTAPVDLTNCDREPIHIPGSLQPHGILLTLDPGTFAVLQAGGDTPRIIGVELDGILNKDIEAVLGSGAAALIDVGA
jgi:light-regulated signal transduction histidine kinase (bacteriophytochrome)